jgi:hypothetical protein
MVSYARLNILSLRNTVRPVLLPRTKFHPSTFPYISLSPGPQRTFLIKCFLARNIYSLPLTTGSHAFLSSNTLLCAHPSGPSSPTPRVSLRLHLVALFKVIKIKGEAYRYEPSKLPLQKHFSQVLPSQRTPLLSLGYSFTCGTVKILSPNHHLYNFSFRSPHPVCKALQLFRTNLPLILIRHYFGKVGEYRLS